MVIRKGSQNEKNKNDTLDEWGWGWQCDQVWRFKGVWATFYNTVSTFFDLTGRIFGPQF